MTEPRIEQPRRTRAKVHLTSPQPPAGLCEIGGWFVRVLSRIYSATAFWSPRPGTPGRGLGRGAASRRILPLTPTLSPKTFAIDVTPNGTLRAQMFRWRGGERVQFCAAQPLTHFCLWQRR